jgi:hypothetical protein
MLARIWNHLPETIKSVEAMKQFVKKLKVLLFTHMFYDMHEFFHVNLIDLLQIYIFLTQRNKWFLNLNLN